MEARKVDTPSRQPPREKTFEELEKEMQQRDAESGEAADAPYRVVADSVSTGHVLVKEVKMTPMRKTTASNNLHAERVKMTRPGPEEGKGQIAIQLFCNYCKNGGHQMYFYLPNGRKHYYNISNFDSTDAWRTMFVADYEPGTYPVAIVHNSRRDTIWLEANVTEGQTKLLTCRIDNPFGGDNGRVVFISPDKELRWRITLNGKRAYYLGKSQLLAVLIPPGHHKYHIENLNRNIMDREPYTGTVYLEQGENVPILIE